MTLKSINPYTNRVIEEFEEFSDKIVEQILNRSAVTFENWKKSETELRRSLMLDVSRLLLENTSEYAGSITAEMGKPIAESKAEIEKCAWVCEYYANHAEDFLKPETVKTDASESYVQFEPLGPVLGIMPWNFPFWQVFRFAVPTIMAGNTVLLKHASNVQICARHIENVFVKAGFPQGVFQNLVLGSDKVENIIENDIVKAVSLTGSESAGRKVAESAGRKIKKIIA